MIQNTLTEVLCNAGIHEYAVSETQKYGHVTYFWNGNRSGKVDEALEVYEEIPSDVIPFEQAPAMKSKEITERRGSRCEDRKQVRPDQGTWLSSHLGPLGRSWQPVRPSKSGIGFQADSP